MRKLIFATCILLSICFNAQPPNGGGNGYGTPNRQQNTNDNSKAFNASKASGIFYYDEKKVWKKLKIKENTLKATIKKYLTEYNKSVQNIALLNSKKFLELNEIMKNNRSSQNRERINTNERNKRKVIVRKQMRAVIGLVKKEIKIYENDLNINMEAVLSEKQFKKWLKHQKSIKDDLMPKSQEKNDRRYRGNGGPPNGGGQRGGMRF